LKYSFLLFVLLLSRIGLSQDFSIDKIEPPNWWAGMKYDTVQVLIYGKNLNDVELYPQHGPIEIINVHKAESPNYLFIDLLISPEIKSDYNFEIGFAKGNQEEVIKYPILTREDSKDRFKGFDKSDVMYLIMADRFCDGNPSNNKIDDSLDQFTAKDLDGRKGGDIEGITSKLDYLKKLGVTSIWITPMLENNMWMSYHGYAATDLYRIDPRFGSNELYKELVNKAHDKGLKIIMDHVSNHIGINHWWMKDLPFASWINGTVENHLPANHNKMTFPDPYSPGEAIDLTWDGWFTNYMVDLNQANPYLKKYLIQNTIWWIEYLGLDGIREDTYPYCNQYAMADWNKAILDEYPNLNIVGEIWTGESAILAAYQQKNKFGVHLDTHLPCVTDFALSDAFRDYLSGRKGLEGIFNVLSQDFLYYDPNNLLTFFDNHDISRGLFVANNDVDKYKAALTILLTTRGIPKILYGSEIGIVGENNHGTIRSPFPGGFENDSRDAFSVCDRTEYQQDIFDFTQNLLGLRKKYKSLSDGRLTHFYPINNIYVYFKETENEKTMVVVNGSDVDSEIDLNNYKETLGLTKKIKNLKSNDEFDILNNKKINIKKKSAEIFLLIK
jgi:neopullulanase